MTRFSRGLGLQAISPARPRGAAAASGMMPATSRAIFTSVEALQLPRCHEKWYFEANSGATYVHWPRVARARRARCGFGALAPSCTRLADA